MQNMADSAKEKQHSTTIEASTLAKKANVKKLLIGHFSARYDDLQPLLEEARSVFPNTVIAEDGMTICI
jgi:ribonuclease Z